MFISMSVFIKTLLQTGVGRAEFHVPPLERGQWNMCGISGNSGGISVILRSCEPQCSGCTFFSDEMSLSNCLYFDKQGRITF